MKIRKIFIDGKKIRMEMAIVKSRVWILSILSFISLLSVFISFSDKYQQWIGTNIWLQIIILLTMLGILFLLLWFGWFIVLYCFNKCTIKKNKPKIILYKKNIFDNYFLDEKKVLLIPADKDFTTNFSEIGKIDENTVHGQFLKKFKNYITEVKTNEKSFLKQFKLKNNNKELTVFFMPLTEIKPPNYVAEVNSINDFLISCKETIEYVNGNLHGRELIMPLIGGGKSRISKKAIFFDDINNILLLWVMYFQIFGDKDLKIGIAVLPNDWHLINRHKYKK